MSNDEELKREIADLRAQLADKEKNIHALHEGRTKTLTLGFDDHTFRLSPIPLVLPQEQLKVEVDWGNNPNGWESVLFSDFEDLHGGKVSTKPETLELTQESPTGQIEVLQKRGPFVHYKITYSRTVNGWRETWAIDPDWEHWP